MAKVSVKKRVAKGVRVLTALYGTRKVWGIGPRAIREAGYPEDAIFARLGIDYGSLTADVNETDLKGVERVKGDPTSEVYGAPLGFYPNGNSDLSYTDEAQALKNAWVVALRTMRAQSIGSTTRTSARDANVRDGIDFDHEAFEDNDVVAYKRAYSGC